MPTAVLKVQATVALDFGFEQPYVRLKKAILGETVTEIAVISNNTKTNVTYSKITVEDMPGLKARLIKTDDGKDAVELSYHPGQIGYMRGKVAVKTSHAKYPELRLSVNAQVQGPIDFAPRSARFFQSNGKEEQQTIQVTVSSSLENFTILSVSDKLGMVEAEVVPVEKGKVYRLVIKKTKKGIENERSFSTKLLVKTSSKVQPEVEIPVAGISRSRPQNTPAKRSNSPSKAPGSRMKLHKAAPKPLKVAPK